MKFERQIKQHEALAARARMMGGEDKPIDVVSFPNDGKRYLLMQTDKGAEFYELGEPVKPFGGAE